MDCDEVRVELSARLDGEPPGVAVEALDAHVACCPACAAWLRAAHEMSRRVRLQVAEPVPDVSARVLAALPGVTAGQRWRRLAVAARLGLLVLAAAQLVVTFPELWLGHDSDVATHPAHELGSLGAAFAVGFASAAARPARARPLVWIVGAGAFGLVGTAIADVVSGRARLLDEAPHLVVVAGWLLLCCLGRLETRAPGTPAAVVFKAMAARVLVRRASRPDSAGSADIEAGPVGDWGAGEGFAGRAAGGLR